MDRHLVMELITIPLFTGTIGYITNWTGVLMLFETIQFHGVRVPGLKAVYPYFPRRIQVLPIFFGGDRLGWQGMVPSRAEKMASLAVDRSLAKVGNIGDFYAQLDPDSIAEHFVERALPEVPAIVERIMLETNPRLWNGMPDFAKEFVVRRVADDLPKNASRINAEFVAHLDDLIDAKAMAVRYLVTNPKMLNDVFREFGAKELRFMINFGFYFGYPMGFTLVALVQVFPQWWILPLGGMVLGWVVNYLGITIIFEPIQPTRWVPWRQGLMLKRRPEVIEGYAGIIATHVMTLENVMSELMTGPRADRTLAMIDKVMHDTVDSAVGRARVLVRTAVGHEQYERVVAAIAPAAMDMLPSVSDDPEFVEDQRARIAAFVRAQMSKLTPAEFQDILRGAVKQDEWLLFVHGGVLGGLAGFLHLAIFGT